MKTKMENNKVQWLGIWLITTVQNQGNLADGETKSSVENKDNSMGTKIQHFVHGGQWRIHNTGSSQRYFSCAFSIPSQHASVYPELLEDVVD